MKTKMPKQTVTSDVPCRRRGRPMGKNRVPLSLEERRARNARYERERRNETSESMAQLAEAAGCEIGISNAELLASVVAQLQREAKRDPSDSIENLRRFNENLMQQIAELEERLGWSESNVNDKENCCRRNTKAEEFEQRNVRRCNIRRHKPLSSDEEISEAPHKQAFETNLYSSSRESLDS